MRPARESSVLLALAAGLLLFFFPGGAAAGERRHTVRAGESASAIAKHYYGDYEKAALLLRYNGLAGTTIHAGETLRVPYSETRVVRAGDSWSGLAELCCGRASAYPALAALNGMSAREPLAVGRSVVLPVTFSHRLGRGESLALLAERWYGDPELGRVLQSFNDIDDPRRLSVGQTVEIPLVSLLLRESLRKASPEPKKPRAQATETASGLPPVPAEARREPEPSVRFSSPLREAELDFLEGDFSGARAALESLREPVLSRGSNAERAELWRLLASVYVSYDLPTEACAAERRRIALLPFPEPDLDPDLVSPKIRETLSRCGSS